jgi:hypothetical protein
MIAVILVGTGALNFYNLMSYTCITRYFCNHTQIYSFCFAGDAEKWAFHGTQERPNPHSLIRRLYVLWRSVL